MTIRPEKLAAVPEGGLDTNTYVDISFTVDGTTNQEKERPKKRPLSLNPTISTTITMGDDSSTSAATSAETSASTAGDSTAGDSNTGASATSGINNKAGATNNPLPNAAGPFLPRDASSRNDVGGGAGGKPRLQKRWKVEEEQKLVSVVETYGARNWDKVAVNVPGRNEKQCREKWHTMSRKAASTASGAWTVEEKNMLASAVETFGTTSWVKVAVNVPGRNENQCYQKWQNIARKAAATSSGVWTVEEEKKLASAVETFGAHNWAKIAVNVPGRNENQCRDKWWNISRKAASTASGAWTVGEEQKLVSAVETFGSHNWLKVAANLPGRDKWHCRDKWQTISRNTTATVSGTWTVEEEKKLASAVDTVGTTSWAKIATNVPGRSETQCRKKWWNMSSKATATTRGTWTVEEENKLVSAVETFGTNGWAKIAASAPGRSENQCRGKWRAMSKRATAT
jgi:myb proto-oncogene protein